jgi:hypothetical protein
MKSSLCALSLGAFVSSSVLAHGAEYFADQVLGYTQGAGVGAYTNPNSALGKPGGNIGPGTFNPFNPNFATTELARIGFGGELTLRLSHYVQVMPGILEIGIWENVGLVAGGGGGAQNPATVFGLDSAVVSVSEDGVTWFSLNNGNPIVFDLPGNYYANATAINAPPPTSPVLADFGLPFTGVLPDFNGQSFAGVLGTFGGSAGGTWLDLDETGLSQVGYIRFNGVAEGQTLEINGVGINGNLAGAAVPEPRALALIALGITIILRRRHR